MSGALLAGCRALDLTDDKGAICGLLLAALGVEVIKIEPLRGDPGRWSRSPGPDGFPPPEDLRWVAENRGKRSVAVDIDTAAGAAQVRQLATGADFLLESFKPGYLATRGLGYDDLRAAAPRLVYTSVTHFGQTGPWAAYAGSDLVDSALSSILENTGEADRPPVSEAPGSTYFFGGVAAALGSVLAHFYRQRHGVGQLVDVSLQEAAASKQGMLQLIWEFDKRLLKRSAPRVQYGRTPTRSIWRCQDGYLRWMLQGGLGGVAQNRAISDWMDDEGVENPFRDAAPTILDMVAMDPRVLDSYESAIGVFFRTKTKRDLREEGARRGIRAAVALDPREVTELEHFEARGFWGTIPDPATAAGLPCPKYFFVASETENFCDRPAPRLGQDTAAVLPGEPGRPAAIDRVVHEPVMAAAEGDQALDGIKVLDFGWELVGPYTGRALAVHGATVIRVESTTRPDGVRTNKHIARSVSTNPDDKPWFAYVNNSKLSLQLDLKHPRSRELIERLVKWADVVNSNFRPGTMAGLGLDYPRLRAWNPRIIALESSILGQTGPLANEAGYDAAGSAWSGRLSLQGWPDREPVTPTSAAYGDEVQPLINAMAIVAALEYRDRTGRGQYIESSMAEILAQQIAPSLFAWSARQQVDERTGNRRADAAPHGVFPCQGVDRWCAISVFTEAQWAALCTVMDQPEVACSPRLADLAARKQNEDALEDLIAAWTRHLDAAEVMRRLQAVGVPAGIVETAQDVMEHDPQLRARELHVAREHPVLGVFGHPTPPYKLRGTPARIGPAPCIGEHNFFICTELLEMSIDEFLELEESGAFR